MNIRTKLFLVECLNRILKVILLTGIITAGVFLGVGLLFIRFKVTGRIN